MPYHAAGTTQRHFRTHIDKDGGILRWERMGRASKWFGGLCFVGNFDISFISKGWELVGRSSDRIAIVDHPEPLHGIVPFKAEWTTVRGGQET